MKYYRRYYRDVTVVMSCWVLALMFLMTAFAEARGTTTGGECNFGLTVSPALPCDYEEVHTVPVPGTLALVGLGLYLIRRKK